MTGSSRPLARLLAVLGLAAAAVAVIVVISSSTDGDENSTPAQPAGERNVIVNGCEPKADAAVEAGIYIVKPDESLSLIAERTCKEEEELSSLNPDLDPQALAPGQCLNLEERGCERLEE
jgi:hypothetical protein